MKRCAFIPTVSARILKFSLVVVGLIFQFTGLAQVWSQRPALGWNAPEGNLCRELAVSFGIGTKLYIGTGVMEDGTLLRDFWEFDPATNAWTRKADFPGTPRKAAVGFSMAGKGYIGTGNDGALKKDLWEYDPNSNTWIQRTDLPGVARYGAVGFAIGTKGYVLMGGATGSNLGLNDVWEFDPMANAWTAKSNFSGTPRIDAAAFTLGALGYVGTGWSNGTYLSDFWQYDPGPDVWIQRAGFGGGVRRLAVGFTAANRGFMGMGRNAAVSLYLKKDIWEFDPQANAWIVQADFPAGARMRAVCCGIGNKGYVGFAPTNNDLWEFDGLQNQWTARRRLGAAAASGFSFAIGNKGYICSGPGSTADTGFWEYDPQSSTWTQRAPFSGPWRSGAAGFSIGSKGYVATGEQIGGGFLTDLWSYDPASDTWVQRANLPGPARYGAVAFSIGSKGYVATGLDQTAMLNDLWEYDPQANNWTQRANVPGQDRGLATGFSIGVKGYVGLGWGEGTGTYLSDFSEYDPATNTWTARAAFAGGARVHALGFGIGAKGYVGIGDPLSAADAGDLWEFDPVANTWVQKPDLPGFPRGYAFGFAVADKGYIGGGSSDAIAAPSWLGDLWEYGPASSLSTVAARVKLEGSYGSATSPWMRDDLRTLELIPLTEPFSAMGLAPTVNPGAVVQQSVLGPGTADAIVDWILLELRNPTNATLVLSRQACLLQRDGDVVATDGSTVPNFPVVGGAYYLAVRHRNHLGVMTSGPQQLSSTPLTVDLTKSATPAYGTASRKNVTGTYAAQVLWAGDATGDGILKYAGLNNDRDPILIAIGGGTPNNTLSNQYSRLDTNMDGVVKYTGLNNDRDIILINVGSSTPNNTRTQQLP